MPLGLAPWIGDFAVLNLIFVGITQGWESG